MASQSANLWVLLGLGLAGILLMTRKFKKVIKEDFGAFVEKFLLVPPPQPAPPKAPHPLTGLTFAVSDVFDIDGYVTSFGHPDWARAHGPASQTSAAVSSLLEGGATCIGRTVVDELAFGISGENKHFGTPTNPAVHARVPGGSSGGAAVAVAAGLVDFSLGIDTVGGVRVPAGFCGVLGFRPSYGAVSHMGLIPVSTSLDTVGWFAKDPKVLNRVGHILLPASYVVPRNPRQIIIADDCFQHINVPLEKSSQVVIRSTEKLFGRQVLKQMNLADYLSSTVPSLKAVASQHVNGRLKDSSLKLLANVMQFLQRHEFRLKHEEWMNTEKPTLHPSISAQLQDKLEVSDEDVENWKSVRNEMRIAVNSLLKDEGVLVIPTVADFPPKLGGKEILSEEYQSRAFSLLSIASISGCCQVSIPLGIHDKCPLSVSLIARHGGDRFLLDTVQAIYTTLQEQAEAAAKTKPSSNVVSQEKSAEIAKEKGNQAFKDKQWQRAVGFYTEAIKLNGNNATYYSNRAAAYLELGSFIQAEADCTKAINLDKKNVKAYFRRGTAREMLGYYKEATDDFKYVLVLEPTNKRAASSLEKLKVLF
ncbi:translocon at the outer membrane of chloroplasts 64 [Prosopis cineraria]|uniref:translocon at the outer membrane of chloroplasts 64 n=1 Tax=Prosopis cineraria TaxID=364024 RepID=UPI002410AB99|nr:translocon at the outer membrane of chloroplasts 64 [Prosopis cineraria]